VAVILCTVSQPFVLGFYADDWPECAAAARAGAPFSKALFRYAYLIDPSRPGLLPLRFLFSSLFADRVFLWHCGLVFANFLVALNAIYLIGLFSGKDSRAKGAAIWIGLCWMLLPWNAVAQFWPAFLPNVFTLLAFGLLVAFVMRGWSRHKHNAWPAGLIYFWICISYEAFYFQWITLALLGLALIRIGRARRKEVGYTIAALAIAQLGAVLWRLYSRNLAAAGFAGVDRPIVPNWPRVLFGDLLTTIPSMFRSLGEARIPFAVIAFLLVSIWLFNTYQSLRSRALGPAAGTPITLAACCLAGGVLSIFAFALGGRGIQATGMGTRTLVLFNFWLIIGVGICVVALQERAGRWMRITAFTLLAGLGVTLAIGHVLRRSDWAEAWRLETKVLAEAPVDPLRKTPANARILYINRLRVNGAPIFSTPWDLNTAMPWKYPFLSGRVFVVYEPRKGTLSWDGQNLAYDGDTPLKTTADLYVWRPAESSLRQVEAPFRLLGVEDVSAQAH
jgi:hypothetical protein